MHLNVSSPGSRQLTPLLFVHFGVYRCGKPPAPPPPPPPPPPGQLATIHLLNSSGVCLGGNADTGAISLSPCSSTPISPNGNGSTVAPNGTGYGGDEEQIVWSVVLSSAGGPIRLGNDGGLCLTSGGESAPVSLGLCSGDPTQHWTIAGTHNAGHISAAGSASGAGGGGCKWQYGDDTCCLDDWNGGMHPGDAVYTYSCWSGSNQNWKIELK